jgi:hypothetical protein
MNARRAASRPRPNRRPILPPEGQRRMVACTFFEETKLQMSADVCDPFSGATRGWVFLVETPLQNRAHQIRNPPPIIDIVVFSLSMSHWCRIRPPKHIRDH